MYNAYQDEYADCFARATQYVEALENKERGAAADAERNKGVSSANQALKDCDGALKAMELEAKTNPTLRMEVRPLRPKLQELQTRFNKTLAELQRNSLLGEAAQQKEIQRRLMTTNATLEKDLGVLDQTSKIALETEVIGQGIMRDLGHQKETIARTRNNMGIVGNELDTAKTQVADLEKTKCSIQ